MKREGYNVDDKGERVDAHVLHFFPLLFLYCHLPTMGILITHAGSLMG